MTDPLVVLSALTDLDDFAPELAWIVVDETGAAEASVEMTVLADVEANEVAAAVTRGTADVEWLTEGESRVLRYSDVTPEADTDGAVPAGVWFYDETSEALRFFLPVEPGAGFTDWPILEPIDGLVRVRRSTTESSTVAVTKVAGVSPVGGDVDAQDLADALAPLIGGGGGGGEPGPWIADDSGLRYRVDRGLVQLGGDVSDWSLASSWVVCTLPPECRPASTRAWYVVGDDDGSMAVVRFTVEATGVVTAEKRYGAPVDSVWASLVGCSFAIDDPEVV